MKPHDEPLYVRRSQASRRRDVIAWLTEHPEYSDRRLCHILAVSREPVRAIRSNMIRLGRIPSRYAFRRVGADGKTYKRLPQRKDANAPTR